MVSENNKQRQLDRIDFKILKALQENARLSYVELAQTVGLSTTPCLERVKRLENSGYIQGYHARLNTDALGLELLVFLEITLTVQSPETFQEFKTAANKISYVQECHLISGQSDYLLKIRISDLKNYRKHLGELLLALPHVRESKSHIVMEEAKQSGLIPLDIISHRFKN